MAIVLAASPARAQNPDQRVNWELGAGYTWTLSDAGEVFGDGYNFNFGVTFETAKAIDIEGLYSFNGLGGRDFTLPVSPFLGAPGVDTPFTADMNMQYGTVSGVFGLPRGNKVRPYGLTGVGVYYRPVTITTPALGFVPGFCDPWLFYCAPGGFVEVDEVVADRSSTDFGMVFGGGVNFTIGDDTTAVVELRYHYIWGPEINTGAVQTLTGTNEINANGQFLPITFGIRF
jgi:opacity protein-like surface antigen